MTTSTTPPSSTIRLTEPSALITAIPALLGFVPTRSLVILCLEGAAATRVGLVMRVDLPDPLAPDVAVHAAIAEQLSIVCARRKTPAVLLVVVEDRSSAAGLPHRALLDAVGTACEAVGTELLDAHVVERVAGGCTWRSYDHGEQGSGVLGDPQSSMVSAAHVAQGRVIHGDRAELDGLFRRDTETRVARRAELVDAALDSALLARELSGQEAVRADLEAVLAAVARVGDNEAMFDEEIARLGAALCDVVVRDACFGLSLGDHADDAQYLWLQLCRALPDPQRAEAAVLAGYGSYVRGDGPLAGIALRVALASHPGHRMATLLETALSGGLPPEVVRGLAGTALGIAAGLGVTLPPATPRPPAGR
ncbi:MAG: DUF4192 domain-containing protein [Mycobacteriaceae bacterium]